MRTVILALKSIRCKCLSFAIIFVQLSVCYAILVYSVCAVFQQFNVIFTANGAHRGYLYISPDELFIENYSENYQGASLSQLYLEFLEKQGLTIDEDVTPEQTKASYVYMLERNDEEFDKYHYKGKYLYSDLFQHLELSGLVTDTIGNIGGNQSLTVNNSDVKISTNVALIDEKLYKRLKLDTVKCIDLNSYKSNDNYFYAFMYPNISLDGNVSASYGIGDILTQEVYNIKEHRMETFYYEIVDMLNDPTYIMPQLLYSGDNSSLTNLETAFLHTQTMDYNGGLIAVKPDNFDAMAYYSKYNYIFNLVKPNENISEAQYSELLNIIRDCGFNVINLDKAEENTINGIISFIRENSVILAASVLIVVFSIISISMLSGSQVRCEYAVYKLCGADLRKLKALSAVKWALVFAPAMIVGIFIVIVYSKISERATNFIAVSALVSGSLFVLLYIVSFILSYKSASVDYEPSVLSE